MERKWRIILTIVVLAIVILGFAIAVYVFKMPTQSGDIHNIAVLIFNFLDEWASAGGPIFTLLLALAAFWAIWQNYNFRKKDRERLRKERTATELYEWVEEAQRLFYLPYNQHKDEIYNGISNAVLKIAAMTTAAIILGDEFEALIKRVTNALVGYFSEMKEKRKHGKKIDDHVIEEFEVCFYGLELYLEVLRIWDYDYDAFIKDCKANGLLPLDQHLSIYKINERV